MKKLFYILLSICCLYTLQACSDDHAENTPEPLPGEDGKGTFSLLLTEKVVQGYNEDVSQENGSYTGAYWESIDSVDIYLQAGGQDMAEKGHRLSAKGDGTLVSDTLTLNVGAYTVSKLVLFDHWGRQVLEFKPTSDNNFVLEENGFVEKSFKVKNQPIYAVARDSLALAALMTANFGKDPAGWPMDLSKAPSTWSFVEYTATLGRITSLRFSTYQDEDRNSDKEVTKGWGSTKLRLKVLPKEMELMDALTDIDLSGNDIEEIPAFFKNIKSVYGIKLGGNKIKRVPVELFAMLRLTILTLDDNPIEALPALPAETSLTDLSMVGCKLTSLGTELANYKHLLSLDVRDNQITTIGNLAGMLTELVHLDVSHNQLGAITGEMLPAGLQALYATNNLITSLPSGWSGNALVYLNVSRNNLTEIPANFFNMPLLSSIFLTGNSLQSLPEVGDLKELLEADFSDNDLLSLPSTMEKCEKLRFLYLSNNERLNWTLSGKMLERYCKCLTEERDMEGNLTGVLGAGPEGLFVKYEGCPSVKGVPTPPKCEYEYEDGDTGEY